MEFGYYRLLLVVGDQLHVVVQSRGTGKVKVKLTSG